MRHRSKKELYKLQRGIKAGWDKRMTDPIMRVAEKGVKKLPKGKAQKYARKGAKIIAEDPLGGAAALAVPGGSAYPFAKKGLEKLIDRFAPVAV